MEPLGVLNKVAVLVSLVLQILGLLADSLVEIQEQVVDGDEEVKISY